MIVEIVDVRSDTMTLRIGNMRAIITHDEARALASDIVSKFAPDSKVLPNSHAELEQRVTDLENRLANALDRAAEKTDRLEKLEYDHEKLTTTVENLQKTLHAHLNPPAAGTPGGECLGARKPWDTTCGPGPTDYGRRSVLGCRCNSCYEIDRRNAAQADATPNTIVTKFTKVL